MTKKYGLLILFLSAFIFSCAGSTQMVEDLGDGSAHNISVDQVCELYIDEPMSADSLYKDKPVETSIEATMIRKIRSLCSDAPEGTFTVEFVSRSQRVVQCFCNAPDQKSVLDSTEGSTINIQGIFKSMTASFFDSESKQCTLTIQNCTFN